MKACALPPDLCAMCAILCGTLCGMKALIYKAVRHVRHNAYIRMCAHLRTRARACVRPRAARRYAAHDAHDAHALSRNAFRLCGMFARCRTRRTTPFFERKVME